MPGGGNPDYSVLSTWEAASDNDIVGYTGPVVLDCYDSQDHNNTVSIAGATNTSATLYREIRSSSSCTTPWAGKYGTGACFKGNGAYFVIGAEDYVRIRDVYVEINANAAGGAVAFTSITNYTPRIINCVAKATNAGAGGGTGFYLTKAIAYNCIALGCKSYGFNISTTGVVNTVVNCVALSNVVGFYGGSGTVLVFNCYAANNSTSDYRDGSSYWDAPSGWNASKDNTADLGGTAGDNYKNGLDLITAGKMDNDGLALDDDLFANGAAGDRYGRNPYNDFTASYDLYDFLKNDTAGDALSKKDIKGVDRPTPDTADVSWNVGASEGAAAAAPYDDGTPDGGIVFGGEVVETGAISYRDGTVSGGIVFGGDETSIDEIHQVDGTTAGGIVFGGESVEQWVAEPNNWVAVKGGTYRISGVIYTLATTMSYEGLGDIAALVNCDVAPAVAGTYRYDLLSVDASGNITVTAGAEATTPVMPVMPASSVKLNHVLRYYGQTSIIQSDIGKTWLPPALTTLTAVIADDELAWAELSTTITITCRDQYGQLFTGSKTVNATFESGNGTIAPLLRSGGGSSFVFTYTRGGNDPGDISPMLTFSSPTGALCVAFIKLLDAGGAIMI